MTVNLNGSRPKRRRTPRLAAGAVAIVLLSGVSAMAQTAPGAVAPSYHIYDSHVAWRGDCVAQPSAGTGQPDYRIYQSHVTWRNDEVPAYSSGSGQQWEIFDSHVARSDECSLHPTVMSNPLPSYSWSDVESLFAGTSAPRG
jgi:hypothetical protein